MPDLQPCPGCARHVARGESSCPFCTAVLAPAAPRERSLQRLSRAAVFGAALASSACGGKPKQEAMPPEDRHVQHHPCSEPDPAKIKELEQKRDEAKTDEEKQAAEQELNDARMPVCAPYGAPPARRRVV